MKFPGGEELVTGLSLWQELILHNEPYTKIAQRARAAGAKVSNQTIGGWMKDKIVPTGYDKVVATVTDGFGVDDVDIFIDYCNSPYELDSIRFLPSNTMKVEDQTGIPLQHPGEESLQGIRTRIDLVSLSKDQGSQWDRHEGHEYILVLSGRVQFFFGYEKGKSELDHVLTRRDAIYFPSQLFHRAVCLEDCEMVVARPAASRLPQVKTSPFQDD